MALGIAPFPVETPTSTTTPQEFQSYVMSAGTLHPQESWRWLAFLSRQAVNGGLPARRSVAKTLASPAEPGSSFWDALDPEVAATYRFALEHSFARVEADWLGWDWLDALMPAWRGEQSVEEALAQAQLTALTHVSAELAEAAAVAPVIVSTPAPVNDEEHPIVFLADWTYYGQQDAYAALADRFHELHPDITVSVKTPEYATGVSAVTLQWLADQGDCFELSPFLPMDESAILSLDPLIQADPDFSLDDFYPSLLEPLRREGQLWILPAQAFPRVMYYNKGVFNATGLAYPSLEWTLDDFLTLVSALTEGEGTDKRYGYLLSPDLIYDPFFFIEQHGARLVDDRITPMTYRLNTSAMAGALRWYTHLIRVVGVPPTFGGSDLLRISEAELANRWSQNFELWQRLIQEGRVAMWSNYTSSDESALWTAPDGTKLVDVGVVPMPDGPGHVGDLTLVGYGISAQTEQAQACWEWLKFLSNQVGIVQGIPARRSVAESEVYRQQVGSELADVYLATLERSERSFTSLMPLAASERGKFVADQFLGVTEAALNGADVEQALAEAQQRVDVYVLCLETTTGYESEEKLIEACSAQAQGNKP